MKTRLFLLSSLLLLGASLIFIACNKEVDEINIDDPNQQTGERIINLTVSKHDGTPLSDYELIIEGPISLRETRSSANVTLKGVKDGTYKIQVNKEGYISYESTFDFVGNDNPRIWTVYEMSSKLYPRNPEVAIDPAQGGQLAVPSYHTGGEAVEVVVPAGALSGTGVSAISISQAAVQVDAKADEFIPVLGQYTLVCEPSGLVFTEPIQVKLPIEPTMSLDEQTGPMVLVEKDPVTGKNYLSNDPENIIYPTLDPSGAFAVFEIPHFSTWTLFGKGENAPQNYEWYRWLADDDGRTNTGNDVITWSPWTLTSTMPPTMPDDQSGTQTVSAATTFNNPAVNITDRYCVYANANITTQNCNTITIVGSFNSSALETPLPQDPNNYVWVYYRYRQLRVELGSSQDMNTAPAAPSTFFLQPLAVNPGAVFEFYYAENATSQSSPPPPQ